MGKHWMYAYMIIAATLIICVGVSANAEQKAVQMKNESTTQVTKPNEYTLKDYNGLLAVYSGNSETPYKVYEIRTDSLPEADILQIRHGITVYSEEKLQELLEDYTS